MRTLLGVLVVIGVAVGGGAYYTLRISADPPASFRSATVKRGDLLSSISATGTVEAEEFVDVGAQVVGPIKEFGVDPTDQSNYLAKFRKEKKRDPTDAEIKAATKAMKRIDYGSVVQENSILAQIDDSVYTAQVDQAQASLVRAQADLEQMKAKLAQADQDRKRARRLRPDLADAEDKAAAENKGAAQPKPAAEKKAAAQPKPAAANKAATESRSASTSESVLEYRAMSDADYDLAKATYEVSLANVAVGEAAIQQGEAALRLAKKNLDYTTIRSPVEGVIIDRRVNVGQTVVATFSAASLFLIAKDLRRVQVWASVNEADIGRIRPGLPVRFTVDAFPGEVFRGKVAQIRLNATMTQNVVTYTVVVETDNSNLRLMPYLTANLQFEVEQRKNVLLVPNTALRWKPRPPQVAPDARATVSADAPGKGGGQGNKGDGQGSKGGGQPGQGSAKSGSAGDAKSAQPAKERADRSRLWVQDGNFVRPIEVQVGMSDGSQTEVSGSAVQEGMEVVVGELRKDEVADGGDTTNPFAPKLFRAGQKKSQ
jgi:HlyD family secretion protein